MNIIDEIEEEGRKKISFQPGIFNLLDYIHKEGIKKAILTRNDQKSINLIKKKKIC